MLIGPDEEGGIGANLLILGIILLAATLLPAFIFGIFFAGQTAEDAWDDVTGDVISSGDAVKFHGRISEIHQTPTYAGHLSVEGWNGTIYFNTSETWSVGDEVIVEGYLVGRGDVMGTNVPAVPVPASISPMWGCRGLCEIAMWIGASLVVVGVGMVALRVRTGKRAENYLQETRREEDDDRDSKKQKRIGWVVEYSEIGIATIQMEKRTLGVGDKILFKGDETNFSQKLATMTIGKRIAKEATKGQVVEIKVKKRVRPYDIVYKIV